MFYKLYILICLIFLPNFSRSFSYFSAKTVNNVISGANSVTRKQIKDFEREPELDDANLNITQLVRKYNHQIEEHTVMTDDGYILKIHRIPPRKNLQNDTSVIFLMHGILDSSDSWVLQGPNKALPYVLANNGFDIWMGNARGNKYSNLHTKMNKTQSDFWKFTWEEIGIYDLPAMIDYILNLTIQDSLYYVGHSQGTTSFLVMNSLKPEYNRKIRTMFALAPVAWLSHAKSPVVKFLANFEYFLNSYTSSTESLITMKKYFCLLMPGCNNILQNIIGNDYKFINASLLPIILGHVPSTSSTLQFVHYGQLYLSGKFGRFDFGPSENLVRYGQEVPPLYNLRNITAPIVLFYSNNDWLSDVEDVSILFNSLPNVYNTYLIENFNHVDYMYAAIAKQVIYSNIIKEINEFEDNEVDEVVTSED